MKPYLVRVRIPDLGPGDNGAITIYVALSKSEEDALAVVKATIPKDWRADAVIGFAAAEFQERRRLRPDTAEAY
jgi:hypothetical protein